MGKHRQTRKLSKRRGETIISSHDLPAECKLLTTRQTADVLNVSVRRLYDLPLHYVKFGTDDRAHKYYALSDVLRFIEERKVRAA